LQARNWLRADQAAWSKVLDDRATEPGLVLETLTCWRGDADLVGLREPAEFDKLPSDERKACLRKLARPRKKFRTVLARTSVQSGQAISRLRPRCCRTDAPKTPA
jgi:hypothetical protein